MKLILLTFIIIMMFLEGRSQDMSLLLQDMSLLLQNEILTFFSPKDLGIVKVRKMDQVEETSTAKVLDFIGLVERYGYLAEEHNVTTEDGYNLKVHRIYGSPLSDSKKKKEIVFIQHGLLASSDSWVLYGPDKDLPFLLADQGYDVWIGNVRGNSYGRSHVNMTTYDSTFWQYSYDDIGTKDLPAMLDYILNYTQQKDLYYIGHSMGGTAIFVLLSSKPEYNTKIKLATCLGPGVFLMKTKPPPLLNEFINTFPVIKEGLREREIYDIFPQSLATVTTARMFCNDNMATQILCISVISLIVGSDPEQFNTTTLPHILSYVPAGISIQTVEHFYQNLLTNDFRKYDYGIAENYKRYKQKVPPSYDFKKITAPIILFYSANDIVVLKENTMELGKRLPNVLLIEEVPFKHFNHIDYLWAIDVKPLLYDRMLDLIQKFNAN